MPNSPPAEDPAAPPAPAPRDTRCLTLPLVDDIAAGEGERPLRTASPAERACHGRLAALTLNRSGVVASLAWGAGWPCVKELGSDVRCASGSVAWWRAASLVAASLCSVDGKELLLEDRLRSPVSDWDAPPCNQLRGLENIACRRLLKRPPPPPLLLPRRPWSFSSDFKLFANAAFDDDEEERMIFADDEDEEDVGSDGGGGLA